MKRLLISGVSILAVAGVFSIEPVQAGEMGVPYDWSGPYFGIKGGYASGKANTTSNVFPGGANDYTVDGFLVGIMSGYNLQSGNLVFGYDSDTSYTDIDGKGSFTAVGAGVVPTKTEIDWLGTARLRAGYAVGQFLPYVTGGLAYADVNGKAPGGSDDKYHFGYAVGGGVEWAFDDMWRARIEYLYADLGSEKHKFSGTKWKVKVDELHLIRAGIAMDIGPLMDSIF